MASDDPNTKDDKSNKRPKYNAFQQQRLNALHPILTPRSVLPMFFTLAVIFAPLGGVLLWASASVQEYVIDYTNCHNNATVYPTFSAIPNSKYSRNFKSKSEMSPPYWSRNSTSAPYTCTLVFDIPNEIGPPVFMYYRLTEFYQNHRKYVDSLNIEQLAGNAVDNVTINGGPVSKCDANDLMLDCDTKKAIYPCGTIANSMFNDTIYSPYRVNSSGSETTYEIYNMTNKGIAWDSDKQLIKPSKYEPYSVVPPPYWRERYPDGYTYDNPIPNLQEDEEFLVWMRTAALPDFSKLSRRNDTTAMAPGSYQLSIEDRFPVDLYKGTKSIILSTRTVMGGRNSSMGIAYVVIGGFCCLVGTLFTIAYTFKPRKLGDESYLSWNQEQEPAATATGRDQGGAGGLHAR